jgi:hypothetical protein
MATRHPAPKAPTVRPSKPSRKPVQKPKPRLLGRKDPEGDIRIKDPGPSLPPM